MISLLKILSQIEELNIQLKPYNKHYAMNFDENIRLHYCGLFFMALLQEGVITEQQQKMLDLWFPAIGMSGRQAECCELALRLAEDSLGEAILLVKVDTKLINALLLDILVFSRVAKPLSDNTILMLEALAGVLGIPQDNISDLIFITATILGFNVRKLHYPLPDLDLTAYSVYDEFLINYLPPKERKLFSWIKENKLQDQIPDNSEGLLSVTHLSIVGETIKFPNEISILENLTSLRINLSRYRFDKCSEQGVNYIKNLVEIEINTFYIERNYNHDVFLSLPDEILSLDKLKSIRIGSWGDDNVMKPNIYNIKNVDENTRDIIKYKKINIISLNEETMESFKY